MFRISEQIKDKRKDVPKFGTKGEEHETICDRKFKGRRWENNNSGESGIQYGKVRQKGFSFGCRSSNQSDPVFYQSKRKRTHDQNSAATSKPGAQCHLPARYANIDIIKGSTDLVENDAYDTNALLKALMQIQDRYDVCIMDTRPAMELITTSALYAADVLITPVCLDKFCRDNLLLVEDKYHHLQEQGVGVEWKIFANKVENKRAQKHTYIDMVERHCWPFMETCISKGAVVENALEYYKPVMKHRSKSQVALDFMDLAMELQEV